MGIPELSILIVTYNSGTVLPACLASVSHGTALAHQVIIVDNASTDGTLAAVEQFAGVHLIANATNVGFARAINQASCLARGRYLLLLNPDTVVHEHALDRLVALLAARPDVGIAAPRVLDASGRIRHNCFAFETLWSMFWFGIGIGSLHRVRNQMLRRTGWDVTANTPQAVDAVTGAALLVRRELFERLGGLDERFFMYCEDGDFCLRARRAGWRTLLVPAAVVTHIGGASAPADAALLNGMIGRHLLASRYRYTDKHWGRWATVLLRLVYAGAGALFWLGSRLPVADHTQVTLRETGRLLLTTPVPSGFSASETMSPGGAHDTLSALR